MDKFVTIISDRLPALLLLILGLVGTALWLFVGAKPPQVWPAVLLVAFAIVVAFGLYYQQQQYRSAWSRPILRLPLKQSTVDDVFKVFDSAVAETCRVLAAFQNQGSSAAVVRTNIFLPTIEGATFGDVCTLRIPTHNIAAQTGLQRNMNLPAERNLMFRPNQGATGRAFVEQRSIGVLTDPGWTQMENTQAKRKLYRWIYVRLSPTEDFRQPVQPSTDTLQFEMTDYQERRIAENVTWIISMPIFWKGRRGFETVGVFNIDCLDSQVTREQLRAIYYRVVPFAGVLAGVLRSIPTDRITISKSSGT
jgi:hypothetical protein